MQSCFDEVKKNFGFGCMRLPMKGKEVDFEETSKMVDMFLANGFNYFDTAHGYLDGQSEIALKKCLTSRYPREAYILTNKLSGHYIEKNEDIRPFFQKQLEVGNHVPLVYGDCFDQVVALGKHLGLEVITA